MLSNLPNNNIFESTMSNRFEWLHRQLTHPDPVGVVFIGAQHQVDWRAFSQRVASWYHTWRDLPLSKWALYCNHVDEFAAALLGAFYAGQTLYLPNDTLNGTMQHLSQWVDGFVGDFPVDEAISAQYVPHSTAVGVDLPDALNTNASVFFLTSGSTGLPKPIAKNIHQLHAEVSELHAQFGGWVQQLPVYATVTHQHFFGFIFRLLWPLLTGRCIAIDVLAYPENLLSVSEADVTLISSPAFLSRLTQLTDWQSMGTQVQYVFSAGGVLMDEHAERIQTLWHSSIIEIYGSTETGAIAYKCNANTHHANPFSPLPNVRVQANEQGFLCIQAPYLEEPNLWYESADKARVEHTTQRTQFELQGRADRIIKLEEKRISLTRMESLLQANDWVECAKVIPIETKQRTILGAVLVLNTEGQRYLQCHGRTPLIQLLKQYLKNHFELLAIPRRWRFVHDIPKNAQDKVEFQTLWSILESPPVCTHPELNCVNQNQNQATLTLRIPSDLVYFEGHFAAQAILPGVTQLNWAIEYARSMFDLGEVTVTAVKQLKFSQIIQPEQEVNLLLTHDTDKRTTQFRYESDLGMRSSGHIVWGA